MLMQNVFLVRPIDENSYAVRHSHLRSSKDGTTTSRQESRIARNKHLMCASSGGLQTL